MAYKTKDGKGPYPNMAGEYCGNYFPGAPPAWCHDETREQAAEKERQYLARMRFGLPRGCMAGTTEQMKAEGWVGLYLKEDSDSGSMDGDVDVPTPPELMEPEAKKC